MTRLNTEERINQLTKLINDYLRYGGYQYLDIRGAYNELYMLQMQLNEESGMSDADLWRTGDLW